MKNKTYSTAQVAEILKVSVRRVEAMLKQKKKHFPTSKKCECGRSWIILQADVDNKTN